MNAGPGGRPIVDGGIDSVRVRYGLDDCCVRELRRLIDTYLGWVAAGPAGRDDVAHEWSAEQLHTAADHGAVGAAFADYLTATGTVARETLDEFADAIAMAGAELDPVAQHIRAVSALADADAVTALAAAEAVIAAGRLRACARPRGGPAGRCRPASRGPGCPSPGHVVRMATGRHCRSPGAAPTGRKNRSQRSVPVRFRPEVQAVLPA